MTASESRDRRVVAFTGGGTGGHIYPGLAVAEALRTAGFSGRILWIGSGKESDRRIVESAGIEYRAIPSGKLRREFSPRNVTDAFRVAAGYVAARAVLAKVRPGILFSKGGYVSVPPCAAAAGLGIPVFTHESDVTPGLATRLNARRAEMVLTSWPGTADLLPPAVKPRVRVVGNPVRAAVRAGDAARGRAWLGVPEGMPIIFFVGGSQGARQVNDLVRAILPGIAGRAFVVHQTGPGAVGTAGADGQVGAVGTAASGARSPHYRSFPYLDKEMPDVLAAADIVAGRAGAGTVWECSALGKPMVLVPLAGAGTRGDQVENAEMARKAGAAEVLAGADATPEALLAALLAWLDDPRAMERAAKASAALSGPGGAAETVAGLILERMGGLA